MKDILWYLESAPDRRQQKKVRHLMKDIIVIVFFASLANANDWIEIYYFAKANEKFLREYLELPGGIPSHDTIQRVFAIISPEFLRGFQKRWNEAMSEGEGEKIKKILALDGKTQRGNGTAGQKANHIVSAVDNDGFCLNEVRVDDKSNEITAIPELLDLLNIKGHIITTDAMGCQTEIVKKIRMKHADYVLALKGNQGSLYEDVKLYFGDETLLSECKYTKVTEKARSGIEKREYWQTDDISWLSRKKDWAGLASIAMTKNTIIKDDKTTTEVRYFISSLPPDVKEVARAIRSHWMVESYHWHLDVTFREDANRTTDKDAAFNFNIIRKIAVNTLKLLDVGMKRVSLKGKRYLLNCNFEKYCKNLMDL
jgi:predicted transposase YbfD/YdcC